MEEGITKHTGHKNGNQGEFASQYWVDLMEILADVARHTFSLQGACLR